MNDPVVVFFAVFWAILAAWFVICISRFLTAVFQDCQHPFKAIVGGLWLCWAMLVYKLTGDFKAVPRPPR